MLMVSYIFTPTFKDNFVNLKFTKSKVGLAVI